MAKNSEATLLLRIKSTGENILSKTKGALSDIRSWAAAAFAALTTGAAVSAFKEAEAATNSLNQALITQGIYTKEVAAGYSQMASELQAKSTFDDDAITAAQATMQGYLGQTKITKELMQATLDLAVAKKMDLGSTAEAVAKSIGTNTNALKRSGVEVDANASKSEKMAQALQGLNSKFGGQADAATQGLGAIDQMNNSLGNLLEMVGEKFAPYIAAAAKWVTQLATDVMNNKLVWETLDATLGVVSGTIASLKFGFLVAKDVVMGALNTITQGLIKFVQRDFDGFVEVYQNGLSEMGQNIKSNFDQYLSEMDAISNMKADRDKAAQDEEKRRKKETEDAKLKITKDAAAEEQKFLEARGENEIRRAMADQKLLKDQKFHNLNWEIFAEGDQTKKLELELQKRQHMDDTQKQIILDSEKTSSKILKTIFKARHEEGAQMLNDMSNMQNSKNKVLQTVGKAAALANITMHTADAAVGSYAAMSAIPGVGPFLAVPAAAAAVAYGAEQAATVAGIPLAEGGIVKARPGGVHAIIGEGGRDEVVVPLENGRAAMGTTYNFIIEGGMLGDATQAKQFAVVLDRELFKLRQSNESFAFDGGII